MADEDHVTAIRKAMGRNPERPPLPKVLDNLPVVEQFAPPDVRMDELEKTITEPVPRLQQLAMDLSGLNFGEMMEFSKGSDAEAQKIWDWSVAYLAKDMKQETEMIQVPLALVVVEKRQRSDMNPGKLVELQTSILNQGLLHPPVMWFRTGDGKWVLSVGERRLRAIQGLAKDGKTFRVALGEEIAPGFVPITPLGDYLDEVGRFEAEYYENVARENVSWQDRIQALANIHRMRLAQNPTQNLRRYWQGNCRTRRSAREPYLSSRRS